MYKLKDIISSGGTNPKINKAIDRYELSKEEKKDIINEVKNISGSSSATIATNEYEYFRVANMSYIYEIYEIGILFTIYAPYVFGNIPSLPMIVDAGTLVYLANEYKQPSVETILNNTKGNVIKVSKFILPKLFGDMIEANTGVPFESMDTFSEFIATSPYNEVFTPITKEEYDEEIETIFRQYIG